MYYTIERTNQNESYLMHHGVKGMKWGVRKQLPSFGIRRQKNRYMTSEQQAKKKERRKKILKRAAIIGGSAAATGLAAYGGYKISKMNSEKLANARTQNKVKNWVKVSMEYKTPQSSKLGDFTEFANNGVPRVTRESYEGWKTNEAQIRDSILRRKENKNLYNRAKRILNR